jgi:hypothetical protein
MTILRATLRAGVACAIAVGLALVSGCASTPASSDAAPLNAADIDRLTGRPWVGTLTYLDYTSKQQTTIDSSLIVTRKSDAPPTWEFGVGYSKEPHADSKEDVSLKDGGRTLGEEQVVSRTSLPDGVLFITECNGQDDNRAARFRFEHRITAHEYSKRKLVRFDGTSDYFERHIYRWKR